MSIAYIPQRIYRFLIVSKLRQRLGTMSFGAVKEWIDTPIVDDLPSLPEPAGL
jgi:hypothetical protein